MTIHNLNAPSYKMGDTAKRRWLKVLRFFFCLWVFTGSIDMIDSLSKGKIAPMFFFISYICTLIYLIKVVSEKIDKLPIRIKK